MNMTTASTALGVLATASLLLTARGNPARDDRIYYGGLGDITPKFWGP